MQESEIDQRYGLGKTRNRDRLLAVVVAVVALVAFLVWAISFVIFDAGQPKSRDIGYEILDQFHAEVTFEVDRPIGQELICEVQVLNQGFGVVGFRRVPVPASNEQTMAVSVMVNTTELGVTGLVDSCQLK